LTFCRKPEKDDAPQRIQESDVLQFGIKLKKDDAPQRIQESVVLPFGMKLKKDDAPRLETGKRSSYLFTPVKM
jgi:hypothetical protein